mmetsp:Transcript_68065/g.101029  ORF Transcript_68065/g.101029 Transcript_68065/m.101029 type:complete len:552 (+) Transcript_68065:110-1765(+)
MGCTASQQVYIPEGNGDEKAYKERFTEDRVLGQGEFGVVKLVYDKENPQNEKLASKELRKGVVFKDNTLYTPMKPEVLKRELEILKTLNGEHYNLKLNGVYESSSTIYMVTEFCEGGEMMEYVAATMKEGLRTEDVSRIGYQVLDAMNHCAKLGIMHRDLKSENIMFKDAKPGSELRIIDYGSGAFDKAPASDDDADLKVHETMAGTAFYTAPEVFQRKYTNKADVWSIGVVMYVLVAGYPADQLQKAYNLLHKSKRDLKALPNMPVDEMPDSYFEMLNDLLTYNQRKRNSAAQVKECDFIKFHQDLEQEVQKTPSLSSAPSSRRTFRRTSSILISGSNNRHEAYIGFRKFELAVTTLLATLLSTEEYTSLLKAIEKKKEEEHSLPDMTGIAEGDEEDEDDEEEEETKVKQLSSAMEAKKKLNVLIVSTLKDILKDLGLVDIIEKIENLKNEEQYQTFSYHIKLLNQFSSGLGGGGGGENNKENATPKSKVGRMSRASSVVILGGKGSGKASRSTSVAVVNNGKELSKHQSFLEDAGVDKRKKLLKMQSTF